MFENKTEDVFENFRNDKKIFDFSNHSTKSKYYDNYDYDIDYEIKKISLHCSVSGLALGN